MKKVTKFIKNNILGFLVGLSLCLNGVVIAENIITANQVTYNDSTVQTELDSLFDAVDINERLGSTDISTISDGTVSGAINTLNTNIDNINSIVTQLNNDKIMTGTIADYYDKSAGEAVWNIHKKLLKDKQSISANIQIGDNSRIIMGVRINYNRGCYILVTRTSDVLQLVRITDTGYAFTTFTGTTETAVYSG